MKRLPFKKITLLFFALVLLGNVFATNLHTFNTNAEQCHLEKLHTSPCAIVYDGDVAVEIEQDTDIITSPIEMPVMDFELISLIQESISPQKTDLFRYYAKDLSPPTNIQLPRSHMVIS